MIADIYKVRLPKDITISYLDFLDVEWYCQQGFLKQLKKLNTVNLNASQGLILLSGNKQAIIMPNQTMLLGCDLRYDLVYYDYLVKTLPETNTSRHSRDWYKNQLLIYQEDNWEKLVMLPYNYNQLKHFFV